MAPAEGTTANTLGSDVLANISTASVLDLLQQQFSLLASSADQLLFEPDTEKRDIFGVFQYATAVNTACRTAVHVGGVAGAHSASVVWVAASFLFCQKLFRVGASVDAGLANSCPIILDAALLSKHCSSKDQLPVRACTHSLCVADVQLVCEANMKLLVPAQLYTAYTGIICSLAKEILTTSLTAVAVQAMLGIASVATAAFIKVGASLNEANLKIPSHGPQFPKEDVSHDLMHSLTKPLYGHHPLLIVTVATCGSLSNPQTGDIDWRRTMKKYEGSLIWLFDWDVAGRDDNLPAHFAAMVAMDHTSGSAPAVDTTEAIIIREKNRIGCLITRWDTATENVLIMGKERKLSRHSGWLCQQPEIVREILVLTASYFQFGFWPAGDWKNVQELWWDLMAYTGSMTRGWMLDHDTEADIGEHNGMNWVCKLCANKILARATARDKDLPLRTVRAQRLAWGPQPYFFYSRRHSGLVRRVYSAKFFARPEIPWGVVPSTGFDHPVTAPSNRSIETMIVYLLNLAGFTVEDTGVKRIAAVMPAIVNPASLGVCDTCEFDGMGLEMMLYGHGIMVIAAVLAEPARRRFCWEMDAYGGRAFPALYSRMLTGCACTAYWIEESTQLGYGWGFSDCGSDSCCDGIDVPEASPVPRPVEESGKAWLKNDRVRANLQCLMEACKVHFEAMDSIKGQMDAGLVEEGWSMLTCVDGVRAMLGMETVV